MYYVLSKDTIAAVESESAILLHLPTAKRGFKTQSSLVEIVNCILYKLKTGIQWHMLPVESLFSEKVLHYKTVFGHYRRWPPRRGASWMPGRPAGSICWLKTSPTWICPAVMLTVARVAPPH